ncbi:hypothetical protein Lser_V15G02680 [Lactuca serriola]
MRSSGSRVSMEQLPEERVSIERLPEEMLAEILIRSEVRDLIRYKSVLNSWKSLISRADFIKAHLEHSYRRDSENDKIVKRRIVMSVMLYGNKRSNADNIYFDSRKRHIIGSSNGLVCITPSRAEYLLINPETREVNKLKKPQIPEAGPLTYGFGYDSSKDDYKVVLGFGKGSSHTCFLIFSSKSNLWEVIGEVDYTCISRVGVLHSGALHWVAYHGSPDDKQQVILSLDLTKDKFKEIPQPDDMRYKNDVASEGAMRLGTMDGCLCVFDGMCTVKIWVMNEYNVRQSWELVWRGHKTKTEVVHHLKDIKYYRPKKRFLCHKESVVQTPDFIWAPRYIPSLVSPRVCSNLVSPHVCSTPEKKRQETSITNSCKVPKLCLVPGSSSELGNHES